MAKQQQKIPLIVEKTGGELWGRVKINNNLIVDSANSLSALKQQIKALVQDLETVTVEDFEVNYDLTSFFEENPLNIADVAAKSGINPGLMRQYASGVKYPSGERLKEIETAIREIGKQLSKVSLHKPERVPA